MAASGVVASESAKIQIPAIYAKMTVDQTEELLKDGMKDHALGTATKLWLLRESNQSGCITLSIADFIEKSGTVRIKHFRYSLVSDEHKQAEWVFTNKRKNLNGIISSNIFLPITMAEANKIDEKTALIKQLVDKVTSERELSLEFYLNPSLQQQARNSEYETLSEILSAISESSSEMPSEKQALLMEFLNKEEPLCSLTCEPLLGNRAAILPSGSIVRVDSLLKHVFTCQDGVTDPFTRVSMTPEDIWYTSVFEQRGSAIQDRKAGSKI